jgi:hypothetical protein
VQLRDLSPVLSASGPFVTVLVGAESAVEQAADRYEMAWKAMAQQLEQQGLPQPVREALLAAKGEHADGEARLVVASIPDATVVLSEPVTTAARHGHLHRRRAARPAAAGHRRDHPGPARRRARRPHRSRRRGLPGRGQAAEEVTVKGRTLHLRKVRGGGWAHHRYQHTAENQWRENAKEIRETAMDLAEHIGAELIIGVGDERELTFVKEGLAQPWDTRWVEIPGGRSRDGSEQLVPTRIRETVALHQATGTLDLLGEYAQERGQSKRACDGVPAVVEALRKAQVQTLLVTTAADQSRSCSSARTRASWASPATSDGARCHHRGAGAARQRPAARCPRDRRRRPAGPAPERAGA